MEYKSYMNVVAFLDDQEKITSNEYILEFSKLALFQNGYKSMQISELQDAIMELTLFEYTCEEILTVISKCEKSIEINQMTGEISLTSEGSNDIKERNKKFPLRQYIDVYCDKYLKDSTYKRDHYCELITKFIFQKYQESTEQILLLINKKESGKLTFSDEFSEEDKIFINGFLNWDNAEKNKMVYNLIVKSYDFCMINCPESIAFDFSNFDFFLDANIIMRLLGINNKQRKSAIERFIDKCNEVGIHLIISNFTKAEIENSIKNQLQAIRNDVIKYKRFQSVEAVEFGDYGEYSLDLYKLCADYCNEKGNLNIDGFARKIDKDVQDCFGRFESRNSISYNLIEHEAYINFTDSLKKIKGDKAESIVNTDANNVMFIVDSRNDNSDTYMISADSQLIRWCKDNFTGEPTLVEYPSAWLSIIMKYTGRATKDDYSVFCKFIGLPIVPHDKDIKKKVLIKEKIEVMDVDSQIKDMIFYDLKNEYDFYDEHLTPDEIAEKAKQKALETFENKVREDERKNVELELKDKIKGYQEKIALLEANPCVNNSEQPNSDKDSVQDLYHRIENLAKEKAEKITKVGKYISEHKNRIVLVGLIIFLIVLLFVLNNRNISDKSIATIIALIEFVVFFILDKILDAIIEKCSNYNELYNKHYKKLKRKHKALLK